MGQSPFWIDDNDEQSNEEDWSSVAMGEITLPGVCKVIPAKLERDIEKKKAKGKSGGTMTDNGYKPTGCTIEVWYWTKEQHRVWNQIFPKINPRREGATKDPFELRYPSVQEAGLGPMFVAAIDLGPPPTAKSGRRIKIYCDEWWDKAKDVKKGGKAKSASTASPRTPLGNYMLPGTDPLKNPGSGLADPSDPNAIMEKALGG